MAVVLVVVLFVVVSKMTKGLPVIASAIERFGKLDLQVKGELERYLNKKDEVGQMARASRDMARALRASIAKLVECRDDIGATAGTLGGATQELSDCVANNAATTEELFASISSTNQSVESVENSVDYAFEAIDDVTKKVNHSDEITKNLMKKSKEIKDEATTSLDRGAANIENHKERVAEAANQNQQAVTEIVEKNENMMSVSDRVAEISDTNTDNSTQIGQVVNQFKL